MTFPTPPEYCVTVRHNFETAHRLPVLGGKCTSLHGHSWWATIAIASPGLSEVGTVAEFGDLKRGLRTWIDEYLDHGAMLGAGDLLVGPLHAVGSKLFVFGEAALARDLPWPTVESVGVLLCRVAKQVLADVDAHPDARVAYVDIAETHVNTARWTP